MCSATFVDNEGNQSPNNVGLKIEQNVYVFGKDTGNWLKMVAYDASGNLVENRYSDTSTKHNAPQTVTKDVWENANKGGDYSVKNMNEFCVAGINVNYRIRINS